MKPELFTHSILVSDANPKSLFSDDVIYSNPCSVDCSVFDWLLLGKEFSRASINQSETLVESRQRYVLSMEFLALNFRFF